MYELVVLYTFADGAARDCSGFENHGRVLGPTPAPGRAGKALGFDGLDDRVVAPPSASLAHLGAIRVLVAARLRVDGRRRTLLEGYLAFSLVVEADGSLNGSVYTGSAWRGVVSPAATIRPGSWFVVEFHYDGRDTFLLTVDGEVVGQRAQNAGRVASVAWPFGLNVGAWPDGNRRCFAGEIEAVQLWRMALTAGGPEEGTLPSGLASLA